MIARSETTKLFLTALGNLGLSRVMPGEGLTHKLSVGRHQGYLSVVHDVYSTELWRLINGAKWALLGMPVSQYPACVGLGVRPTGPLDLSVITDVALIQNYMELILELVVAPYVSAVRTPRDYVEYAMTHGYVLGRHPNKCDEVLRIWSAHYGVPFVDSEQPFPNLLEGLDADRVAKWHSCFVSV